jgi:hypothetical protein
MVVPAADEVEDEWGEVEEEETDVEEESEVEGAETNEK